MAESTTLGEHASRLARSDRRDRLLAAALGLLVAAWAAVGMWMPSLWADEAATISGTQRTWPQLWHLLGRIDAVHGTYYVLVKLWSSIVPLNAVTLRLPSLVAIGAATAVTFLLARTWLTRPAAVLAALIFGLLPRSTWMAIEGRSWAIGTLVAVAATLVLVRWATRGGNRYLVIYFALMAVGINLHIYLVFLAAAHGVSLLANRAPWRRLRSWLVTAGLAVAVAVPVILTASRERAQLGDRDPLTVVFWLGGVGVKQYFIGDTPGDAEVWVPRLLWTGASVGLAVLGWLLVAFAIVMAVRGRRSDPSRLELLTWAVPWVAIPPLAILLASLAGAHLYHPRYFGFTTPAFALALAAGVDLLPRLILRRAVAVVLLLAALPVQLSQRDTTSKAGYDWAQAAAVVQGDLRPGDGVYFSSIPPTRTVAIAYPSAFRGSVDLALESSPPEHGSLAGKSYPLDVALRAHAPTRIWGLWSVRAENQAAEISQLTAAGYREVRRWTGPETTVALFER